MKADRVVFLVCYGTLMFILGGTFTKPVTLPAKECPVVQGAEPISTSNTKDGEYCYYVRSKGKVVFEKRI